MFLLTAGTLVAHQSQIDRRGLVIWPLDACLLARPRRPHTQLRLADGELLRIRFDGLRPTLPAPRENKGTGPLSHSALSALPTALPLRNTLDDAVSSARTVGSLVRWHANLGN
jgi:hypothetical protein